MHEKVHGGEVKMEGRSGREKKYKKRLEEAHSVVRKVGVRRNRGCLKRISTRNA